MWAEYAQGCTYVCVMYMFSKYAQGPFMFTDLMTVDLVFHVAIFCWCFPCAVFFMRGSTTSNTYDIAFNSNLGFLRFEQPFYIINRHRLITGGGIRYNRPYAFFRLGVNGKKGETYAYWDVIFNFSLLAQVKDAILFLHFPCLLWTCKRDISLLIKQALKYSYHES